MVCEYTLDQLESKCLVAGLELKESRTLSVTQRVARGRTEWLCRRVRKSYRFKFILR
jgi:hypothetical protein